MSLKTDAELLAAAQVIIDEAAAGGNTKARVGGLFKDIVDSKGSSNGGSAIIRMTTVWDNTTNAVPSGAIGSGTSGAIMKGNTFYSTGSGVVSGLSIENDAIWEARQHNPTIIAHFRISY